MLAAWPVWRAKLIRRPLRLAPAVLPNGIIAEGARYLGRAWFRSCGGRATIAATTRAALNPATA